MHIVPLTLEEFLRCKHPLRANIFLWRSYKTMSSPQRHIITSNMINSCYLLPSG